MAPPNMTSTPPSATAMAIQVCARTRSRRNSHAATAANSGDMLIRTKVLATVVRVSEPMKKKNVPARNSPAITPGQPAARTAAGMPRPCMTNSTPATKMP